MYKYEIPHYFTLLNKKLSQFDLATQGYPYYLALKNSRIKNVSRMRVKLWICRYFVSQYQGTVNYNPGEQTRYKVQRHKHPKYCRQPILSL